MNEKREKRETGLLEKNGCNFCNGERDEEREKEKIDRKKNIEKRY